MEESSEAHMETDVSSTTDDVPEAQEVTASNGNVEMVVIVEKITEAESNTTEPADPKQTVADIEVATSSNTPTPSPRPSPKKTAIQSPRPLPLNASPQSHQILPQKPVTEPKPTNSPNKDSTSLSTSLRTEHAYNKSPLEEKSDVASLSSSQSEEAVDSSSKIEMHKSPENTPKKLSPIKVIDIQKSPKIYQADPKCSPDTKLVKEVSISSPPNEITNKPALNGSVDNTELKKEDNTKTFTVPIVLSIEKEVSNDSQMDLSSDVSEKEHNKSISRELKSLIKSAKESKIISECTQLTTKTRKSRAPLDVSNSSLNTSLDAEKIKDTRRCSNNSQKSNCSEKAEKVPAKRSMRSQNPEFVNKVKQFLNSVTSKVQKESDEGTDDDLDDTKEINVHKDIKDIKYEHATHLPKKKKVADGSQEVRGKLRSDPYCWRCHWELEQGASEKTHAPMCCTVCPRAFHYKCLSGAERSKISVDKNWVCPECMGVLHAESSETRSPALKKISLGRLCELLKHALERMMDLNGVEPFVHPVDRSMFPDYDKYVVHPMDLTLMKGNIDGGLYGSTEAFQADAQWILHNSIIFNTCEQRFVQSKLTASARMLVRSCRAEMGEIEACPECYAAAHARKPTWFTDVCTTPHMLLWAKLKGFPYWPAKGMSVNNSGLVDVRFFGAHDRAWVPAKDCYLYSEKDPNNFRTKRQDILDSMQEAEEHIRNISRKYGKFVYPPFKTQFDPTKLTEQLKMMIPSFEGEVGAPVKEKQGISPSMVKNKRRSNSKSSKSSHHDGDTSEGEESSQTPSRKMSDGPDILKTEDDEKDKTMEVDVSQHKDENEKSEKPSKKRRRSDLEEAAFFTIISSSSKKKKKDIVTEEITQNTKAEAELQPSAANIKDGDKLKEEDIIKVVSPASKSKENEPTSIDDDKEKDVKSPKLTPIKLVISTKSNKIIGKPMPKGVSSPKVLPIKIRQPKMDKHIIISKISKDSKITKDKSKAHKHRNSKSNKSLNSSGTTTPDKPDKTIEKKSEKTAETVVSKERKDSSSVKNRENGNKSITEKPGTPKPNTESPKPSKDRIKFDDDTSLAIIAREVKGTVVDSEVSGLPMISSVRSLSATALNSAASSKSTPNMIEVTIEPSIDSLLVPTSSSNVRAKVNDVDPSLVGRVGVRAFARMTSPERSKDVEVDIKAEPMDLDDQDRQMEKLDMMKAFKLRPVNPPANSLREVRINKVVMTPLNARKTVAKPTEARPRARKTFPQPRKADDGRSELNSKNSMVYIPIKPPTTPGPLRASRPGGLSVQPLAMGLRPQGPRPQGLGNSTISVNNMVNTVTSPLMASSISQLSSVSSMSTANSSTLPLVPTLGQIPTTVHTVPLITSVNGQWTFSLQPIMSVGGVDDSPSPPLLNGLPERVKAPGAVHPQRTSAQPPISSANNVVTSANPITPASGSTPTAALPSVVMPAPGPFIIPTPAPIASLASPAPTGPLPVISSPGQSAAPLTTLSAAPVVTPNRTNVDANANPGEPPRLQQRPLMNPLDSHTPIGEVPTPSIAGPVTAKLNQNAVKLSDFFRSLLEDSLEKLDEPLCQVTSLKLQLEKTEWKHKQEMDEMKHNHELVMAEMRSSFEKDKMRLTNELRRASQVELEAAVKNAKSKQWCANCSQEAQFYCCWNTSYCDYPCQRAHWTTHYAVCTQQRGDADAEGRLQPQPDTLPKSSTAPSMTPTLTVGGKLAQARVSTVPGQDQSQKQQQSIIMSMLEDKSGNHTLRCLGTYKPSSAPAANQLAPIIINKQILSNDDTSGKKVVTSGGYLIVGANASNSGMVTPPRRTHSIQYFT